jgi:hypothetical protein
MRSVILDPARQSREPAGRHAATATEITVYASIGNSDDALAQVQWSEFHALFTALICKAATRILGDWLSAPASRWQNACVCFEIGSGKADRLKRALGDLAAQFDQESIAWAEVAETQFLGLEA